MSIYLCLYYPFLIGQTAILLYTSRTALYAPVAGFSFINTDYLTLINACLRAF